MTIQTMLLLLLRGFGTTLSIFLLTLLGSLPLGLVVYFGKKAAFSPLRWLVNAYISIMRGTPLMLQLMVVYFGPSALMWAMGMPISLPQNWRFLAVAIGFVVNYAAYFAEIYRGGIESIPPGQYEAAQVLGYTRSQTFLKIILPQMVKRVMPSVTNEVITLVKDTSLASVVGIVEMFTRAQQINSAPNSPGMLAFLAAGIIYYVFNALVTLAMDGVEKKLSYYQ